MDIESNVKNKIAAAPFGSDERNILRLILGEIAYAKGRNPEGVLNDLLKQNEFSMKKCRFNTSEMNRIKLENKLLKGLLGQEQDVKNV